MGRFTRNYRPITILYRGRKFVVRRDRVGLAYNQLLKEDLDYPLSKEYITLFGRPKKGYPDVRVVNEKTDDGIVQHVNVERDHPIWKKYRELETETNKFILLGKMMEMYPEMIEGDFRRQYARLKQYINTGKDIDEEFYHIVNDLCWTTGTIVNMWYKHYRLMDYESVDPAEIPGFVNISGEAFRTRFQFEMFNFARGRISAKLLRNKIISKPIPPMEWDRKYYDERWRFREGSKCISSPHMDFMYYTNLPYRRALKNFYKQLHKYNQKT